MGSEHRGTWKQLEGPGRWAPFQPFSRDTDLRSPPFEEAATWSMRFQGVAPPTGCVRYQALYKRYYRFASLFISAIPSLGDLPYSGIEPQVSYIADRFFTD